MPASSEAIAATRRVAARGDFGRGPGGVGGDDRLEPELADQLAALRERVDMAADRADLGKARARQRQQMMVHPLEMLADDVQPRIRHQMMDVGDPAGDRILDRDHRQARPALAHRGEGVLELVARQGRHLGKDPPAGEVGIGPGGALKRDRPRRIGGFGHGSGHDAYCCVASSGGRARDRPGCRPERRDAQLDQADRDAHAGFERAQLLEPLALFEHAARQRDEPLERGAAIGVEPDMLVMRARRPTAPRPC